MREVIKTPSPHRKKLFEWDKKNQLLIVVKNRKQFMFELGADKSFKCVAILDKPHQTQEN